MACALANRWHAISEPSRSFADRSPGLTIADGLRIYCEQLAPGTRVVARPLSFMTVLDRTVLRGQLHGTLDLMRALQHSGERGDPSQTNRLLGAPTTTLLQWCQQHRN